MLNIVEGALNIIETVADFCHWRGDWNRTWSPVSYWLAFAAAVVLLFLVIIYAQEVWQPLQALWGRVS